MRRLNAAVIGLVLSVTASVPSLAARASSPRGAPAFEPLLTPMREPGIRGGRFVIAVTSDPRTLNPMLANETSSTDVTDRLFTALAEFNNATQQYAPALAKGWEASGDGLAWTWHLRRGARFSDGRPITSADVVFSFAVATDSALKQPISDALKVHGQPIAVSAPDSYSVITRIARPFALMVPTAAAVRILPRHVLEPAWRAGGFGAAYAVNTPPDSLVTSGAWRLKQYAPHEKTVLARNPYWFGIDARGQRLPYLDELVYRIVPDQNTAALEFQSRNSEVDGLDNVKPEDYATYAGHQARDGFTLYDLGPTLSSNFFWFNLNVARDSAGGKPAGEPSAGAVKYAWFSSREFRRAVSMAIDRDAMIRAVFFGEAVKTWSVITPGNKLFYDEHAPKYDYDPAAARRLLERLGFRDRDKDGVIEDSRGNPVRLVLKTNANSNVRVQLANFVRDDLKRIGIDCTLAPVDFNTMIGNIQDNFDYDAVLGGLGSTIPPDPGLGPNFYLSSGSTHFWNMRQPRPATPEEARIDSLFERIITVRDPATRKRISAAMDRIIGEQCWVVWLPVPKVEVPVRNRFGNLAPSSIRQRLLWNIETVFVRSRPGRR